MRLLLPRRSPSPLPQCSFQTTARVGSPDRCGSNAYSLGILGKLLSLLLFRSLSVKCAHNATTSLGCLGLSEITCAERTAHSVGTSLMRARDDCGGSCVSSRLPRPALTLCAVTSSAPLPAHFLSTEDGHWSHHFLSIPMPTVLLGDFKSAQINRLSISSQPHFKIPKSLTVGQIEAN